MISKLEVEYSPALRSLFGDQWYFQELAIFIPLAGIPDAELAAILSKEQLDGWKESQGFASTEKTGVSFDRATHNAQPHRTMTTSIIPRMILLRIAALSALVLLCALGVGSARAQDPSLRFGGLIPPEVDTIYERGLTWLAARPNTGWHLEGQ